MKYIITIISLTVILVAGCETPQDLNRVGDVLTGNVYHMDTNLYLIGGYYTISIYSADSTFPFTRVPVRTDSLNLKRRDYIYDTPFRMEGVPAGNYYLAATWSTYPRIPDEVPIVLGTYGCDTSRTCVNHFLLVYPNFDGNARNFTAWTDLSKRLF